MNSKDILFISSSSNETIHVSKINFNDIIIKSYHTIIILDLFSSFSFSEVKEKIDYYKTFLKKNGKIIFIEQLLTNDNYQPMTIIKHILSPIVGKNIKMEDMYDNLKDCGLYILDTDRIYSDEILFSSIEYFSIICEQ
jgi:hypothetical protein